MVKIFWVSLACLIVIGMIALGVIGIPAKPVAVTKPIPDSRLAQ